MSDINKKDLIEKEMKNRARGVLETLGISLSSLNSNSLDLLDDLDFHKSRYERIDFLNALDIHRRVDFHANGMLAEILKRTPVFIYDHPMIKREVNTAFVDTTGRMFICDTFFQKMKDEWEKGLDSFSFIFGHEVEHLRRFHTSRGLEDDPKLANIAYDMRINADLHLVEIFKLVKEKGIHCQIWDDAFKGVATSYFESIKGSEIIMMGHTNSVELLFEVKLKSEETILAELRKKKQDKKQNEPEEFSFKDLCEGVAQDLENIKRNNIGNIVDHKNGQILAKKVRDLGAVCGNKTKQELLDILKEVFDIKMSDIGMNLDLKKDAFPVNTKDKWINSLAPTVRMDLLTQAIQMKLSPSSAGSKADNDGVKVKDLDIPGGGDPTDNHIMSGKDLSEKLDKAGLGHVAEKLGLKDLEEIGRGEAEAKSSTVGAINQSIEDMSRVGADKMPGAHMINYASAQMRDLYKPVTTIKMRIKEMVEESGIESRFSIEEPWTIYHMDAADLGLDNQDDIPYMGSFIQGGTKKPTFIVIIDTSGSVDDLMLKRFISEAINAVRTNDSGENPPEIIISFADTICRGEPLMVTEENYMDYIRNGVPYGGRGGTNFTASTQNIFKMYEEGQSLNGRRLDGIVYLTDGFDAPPEQSRIEEAAEKAGFQKLPPMMFIVPEECYNKEFADEISSYAEVFKLRDDSLAELDFNELEDRLSARGGRNSLN